jgi:folate-binding Fe-S cluster repair protein YgfZ
VARTHFLGQAKRGLVRLSSDTPIAAGQVFMPDAPDRPLGTIASTAGNEALAVLPIDSGDGRWLVAGTICHGLPLLEGLAR